MAHDLSDNPDAVIRACFADMKVKLPLRPCDEDVGVVLDDDGCDVFTVDSNGQRDDAVVSALAFTLASMINIAAGFDEETANG